MEKQELYDKFWMFYYEKHDGDHDKAEEEIRKLDLTELHVTNFISEDEDEPRVFIKLRRPGILIGPKGNNVLGLQEFLGMKLHIEEETKSTIADELIPWKWDGYEDF